MKKTENLVIFLYLTAIVVANLVITELGAKWSPLTALVFIGFDITCRDALHSAWKHRKLVLKMFLLISAGSVISYWLNSASGSIAIASAVSFGVAGVLDALVYGFIDHRHPDRLGLRVNGSNLVSAAVDSLVFPTLAFGSFMPLVVLGQFLAKTLGGWFWFKVLMEKTHKP